MALFDYSISVVGDCNNTSSGSITLTLTGGTPPYSVEWITPIQAFFPDTEDPVTISGLFSDTYVARVNDSTLPINLEFFINIPVSSGVCGSIVSVSPATCNLNNGVVIATSSSNYSSTEFSLYDSNDNLLSTFLTDQEDVVFGGLSAGTYYLGVSDLGGCSAKTQSFIIEQSTSLDYGLYIVPNPGCTNLPMGKIYITGITGTPPFEYLWSNGQTGDTITGLTTGAYSVQVTDGSGCSLSKPAVVTSIDPIAFGAFSASTPTCFTNNGAVTLIITGGTAPYFYSASTGAFVVSYAQSFTISNLYAGQYNFLVKDAALCTLEVGTALSAPTGINSVEITTQNSTCSSSDGIILSVVNGGTAPFVYTLISSQGTNNYTNALSTFTFTGLTSGDYTVVVQDANGCGYTEEVTLIATDKFTISTETTGTTCNLNNGSITVFTNTGFTTPLDYSLDGQQVVVDTELTAITFSNVSFGQHTVEVTDFTGCIQRKQVYVNGSIPLIYSLYTTSCVTGSEGSITIFISSGTPPFTFDWSENVFGNPQNIIVSGLSAGTYSVTVTDATGCSIERDVIIECSQLYTSYQSYVMGEEVFNVESPTKCGIQTMYTEGFVDLTSGNTNCSITTANFEAIVSVNPLGLSTNQVFFTSDSLLSYPSDDLWYLTIKTLLYTIPGVGGVLIDANTNKITIQTLPENLILNGQEIIVELRINYDISCDS